MPPIEFLSTTKDRLNLILREKRDEIRDELCQEAQLLVRTGRRSEVIDEHHTLCQLFDFCLCSMEEILFRLELPIART